MIHTEGSFLQSWRWVELGEVCEVRKGVTPRREWYADAGLHIIKFRDIGGEINWEPGVRGRVGAQYEGKLRRLRAGMTLIGADAHNPEFIGRKVSFAGSIPEEPVFFSGELLAIAPKPDGRIASKWPFLWFSSRDGYMAVQKKVVGVHLNSNPAKTIEIPLPPVSEQERIIGVLDRQMGAVERARGAAVDRVEAARALGAAFVREIFDFGGRALPRGWKRAELGEVCLEDRRGIDGASGEAAEMPYLSLENVESVSGRIVMESNSNSRGISNCFRFGPEHILYGKLRPYLNKVALPNSHGRCTTELIPLLPKQNIRREFLALLLRRPETVDWAMSEKTGSRMPRANMKRLMKLDIFLPPVSEQTQIIATLNAKMAEAEQARAAAEAELEAIEALPGALLRRAFGGEL